MSWADSLKKAAQKSLDLAVDASRLQPVTYRRITLGSHDPAAGLTPETTTDTPVLCALADYEIYEAAASGGQVLAGDRRMLVAADELGLEPDPVTDRVVIGGRVWNVVRAEPLGLDEARLYRLQLRRA